MTKTACLAIALAIAALGPAFAGEGRIPIWQPTTITQPGHYVVTRNVDGIPGAPVIEIAAGGVEVDLNGFGLNGAGGAPVIRAVGQQQISIRNGHVNQGTYGIEITGQSEGIVIEDLSLEGWTAGGIRLDGAFVFAIRRNHLDGQNGDGIAVLGGGWGADGVIEDNHLRNGGGIIVREGKGVAILNNRLHDIAVPFSSQGAIHYENAYGGRIVGNAIHYVSGSIPNGVYLSNVTGCEVRDNSVTLAFANGIMAATGSGNLVLENTVAQCAGDGMRIGGSHHQIDRNLLIGNGTTGTGFGLHFTPGGFSNTYGRNMARGNSGGPCLSGGGMPATIDFCDESFDNSSFNDNYLPTAF